MKKSIALLAVTAAMAAMAGNALAGGNAAAGKEVFEHTCANCHTTQIGLNKVGPTLWDIVGRPVASVPDYSYSEKLRSMRDEWKAWNAAQLDMYLTNPREVLHGVKMFFKGLPEEKDRQDVIAYLETLK
jgi:cytochrome c